MLAVSLFASLLQTFHTSHADLLRSMVSGQLLGGTPFGCNLSKLRRHARRKRGVRTEASGKSGELFWRTFDQRYVLKTVSKQEVGQLIKMLPEYEDAAGVA